MTTPKPPCHALAFKRRLLAWFRREGRDLPWRRTRDPYHVLVSEFMLQQTQVARVTQYYGRFLNRYPTIKALAKARPKAVREAWDGLGYYRRAANLHSLAKTVERDYGGKIPTRPAELRRLPGVGAYTAGAVLAFAYEQPAAVVDTNVERVIRRAFHPRCATDATPYRHFGIPLDEAPQTSIRYRLEIIRQIACSHAFVATTGEIVLRLLHHVAGLGERRQ